MKEMLLAALLAGAECGAPGPLAISPCIVASGHVQVEGNFVSAGVTHGSQYHMTSITFGPLVVKVPLNGKAQVETLLGPLDVTETRSRLGGTNRKSTQLDALASWLKVNVVLSDRFSAALRGGLVLAPVERGSKATLAFGTPLAVKLPADWSFTLNPEIDIARGAAGFQNLAALSRPIDAGWTGLVEISSARATVSPAPTQHTVIVGLDYRVPDTIPAHLDIGAGDGLNAAARGYSAYFGFSVRL